MNEHRSLRERLSDLWEHDEPVFEPSADPTLVAFAQIFIDSELFAFDANKHLRTDALSPIYDCETESRREAGGEDDQFVVHWSPVWAGTDPVTGFRTGRDSTLLGSTPTVAMPQDERTAALLLLVNSTFVHLSASREGGALLVQGAVDADDGNYHYLTLAAAALPVGPDPAASTASEPIR